MKKRILFVICGLLGVMTVQAQPLLKTHVETGDVEGVLEGNDLACYYAIPFAAPPVGDLRWKAPQPAKPWTGVLKGILKTGIGQKQKIVLKVHKKS